VKRAVGRFAVGALVAILVACSTPAQQPSASAPSTPGAADAAPLTILGAASLMRALDRIKPAWEAAHPGSTLTISTDSSAALETQIEQGAPVDVFLSADAINPNKLIGKGLTDGGLVNVAGNVLTIVAPTANPGAIQTPADLARSGVKIIAAGDDVPITKYATQVVQKLGGLPGYPSGFAAAYAANVVSKEDNVKALVAKIELGEGDAGIVYVTDARASTKVATIAIPAQANVPATYAGVVVRASAHQSAAHAFLDWVAGPDGQAILATFGFQPPPAG
jgi:molybdate transport system substrate-binding protein